MNTSKRSVFLRAIRGKKGSILVVALWSLSLLASFAVYASLGVRQRLMLVKRFEERDELHYIAEAGVKKAVLVAREEGRREGTYNALNGAWSNNPGSFRGIHVGGGSCDVGYAYTHASSELSEFHYGLIDEERKININTIDVPALTRLCQVTLGLDEVDAQELAASLVDWRDEDSFLSIPLGSAEDSYYRGLRYAYEAKDTGYEVLGEVLLVKGMTDERYEGIRHFITIYGDGKINVNTASREVFLALGIHPDLVRKLVAFRDGEDGVAATADDNIFEIPGAIVSRLSQSIHLSEAEVAELTNVENRYLKTRSDYFSVHSIARYEKRKDTTEVHAVIDKEGKILSWRET
jgi:type II secretory pathway component PulK